MSDNRFSPCIIAQWIERIRKERNLFRERDTIEHVIVPVLHCIGYDVDSPSGCCLVRDNNDNRSNNQNWDLNLYQVGVDKTMSKLPSVVIEAKSLDSCLENAKWGVKKNGMVCWQPKLSENETVKLFKTILESKNSEYSEEDKKVMALKNYVMGEEEGGLLFDDWIKGTADILKEFFIRKTLPTLFDSTFNNLTDQAKCIVLRVCTKQSNPTEDYFGQIWRYCLGGRHCWNRANTKVVWTNGIEWIVFKKAFYDFKTPPKIVWDSKKNGFDDGTTNNYLKYVKLPELDDDSEFDSKWEGKIEELRSAIGPVATQQTDRGGQGTIEVGNGVPI